MLLSTSKAFEDPAILEVSEVVSDSKTLREPDASFSDFSWDYSEIQSSYTKLYNSILVNSRQLCFLEDLSDILSYLRSSAAKLLVESKRVGALSKSVALSYESVPSTIPAYLDEISKLIKVSSGVIRSLENFLSRFRNPSFSILKYLNMNRVAKAERLFKMANQRMIKLYKYSMMLKFHSMGQFFVCAVRIRRKLKGDAPALSLDSGLMFGDNAFLKPSSPEKDLNPENEEAEEEEEEEMELTSYALDVSLNASLGTFVSSLPKTKFTPNQQ